MDSKSHPNTLFKIRPLFILLLIFSLNFSVVNSKLIELDEDNWHEMLQGEWMVEFFAPWCPACRALQPIWKDFAGWSDDLGISIGQVDITSSPGLSGRFMVTALPTIFHIKDGVFRQYRGARDKDEFMNFIEEKKWESLEEISAWKNPASFQMSVISQFFKVSMVLRGVHSSLIEDYGLPPVGSYILFGLATIFIGAMLGLILVCIIDYLFPPAMVTPLPPKLATLSASSGKNSDEEDLIEDEESQESQKEGSESPKEDSESQKEDSESQKEDSESQNEGSESHQKEGSGDGESPVENSDPEEVKNASASSSPSVRKRRARKAD